MGHRSIHVPGKEDRSRHDSLFDCSDDRQLNIWIESLDRRGSASHALIPPRVHVGGFAVDCNLSFYLGVFDSQNHGYVMPLPVEQKQLVELFHVPLNNHNLVARADERVPHTVLVECRVGVGKHEPPARAAHVERAVDVVWRRRPRSVRCAAGNDTDQVAQKRRGDVFHVLARVGNGKCKP